MSVKINKQISFVRYEANLKFANDPMKFLFDKIDFSFSYPLAEPFYKSGGRPFFDQVSIFKALLFIYMNIKIQSERQLDSGEVIAELEKEIRMFVDGEIV
ncbi:MAG: hypothetical protein V1833_03205 [Elusimicrobiota bacterium]